MEICDSMAMKILLTDLESDFLFYEIGVSCIFRFLESIPMCVLGQRSVYHTNKQYSDTNWVSYNTAQFWDSIRS